MQCICVCFMDDGCSLNIVFFEDFKKYAGLWPLSRFPLGVSVSNASTAAELSEFRESQNLKEKDNIK